MSARPELVVLSHLDWDWVWQRPQQLVSRLACWYDVCFVEEPRRRPDLVEPRLAMDTGIVTTVRLELPGPAERLGYDDPDAAGYADLLAVLAGPPPSNGRIVWAYTPLALPIGEALAPSTLVYDVMDDLTSFQHSSPNLPLRHLALLRSADLVFTGGRSLHAKVLAHRRDEVHCFPSGVDCDHYRPARTMRRSGSRPVAGYVGVIDERVDLELVEALAALLPDWDFRMVGPVAKIEAAALPTRENVTYLGKVGYADLPRVLATFDVALMPFALNDATRSISPTKTAEYLAAGLPVVSTPVADVVADFGRFVEICDDALSFAAACRRSRAATIDSPALEQHLAGYDWQRIVEQMLELVAKRGAMRAAATDVPA